MKSSCSPCMCLAFFHPDFHSIVAHGQDHLEVSEKVTRSEARFHFVCSFSVDWVVLQKQPWHTYSDYRMKSSCSPCMCLAFFHPDFHSIVAHGQDHLEVSEKVTRSEARFHFVCSFSVDWVVLQKQPWHTYSDYRMKSSCSPCMCLAFFHPDFHSIVAHGQDHLEVSEKVTRSEARFHFVCSFSVDWVVQKQPWHTYSDYRMKSSCSPCMCLAFFHPDFHSIVAHGQDHLEVSEKVTRSEARFHFVCSFSVDWVVLQKQPWHTYSDYRMKSSCSPCMCLAFFHPDFHSIVAHGQDHLEVSEKVTRSEARFHFVCSFSVDWVVLQKQPWHTYSDYRMKSSCSPCMCLAFFHPDFHSIVAHGQDHLEVSEKVTRSEARFHFVCSFSVDWVVLQKQPWHTYSDYRMKSSCSPCMCLAFFHPDFHSIVAHGQDHLEVSEKVTQSEARFHFVCSFSVDWVVLQKQPWHTYSDYRMKSSCSPCMCLAFFHPDFHSIVAHGQDHLEVSEKVKRSEARFHFVCSFSVDWVVLQKQPWHTYSDYRMKSSCSPCMCLAFFHPDFHSIVAHGQDHLEVSEKVTRSEARFHFVCSFSVDWVVLQKQPWHTYSDYRMKSSCSPCMCLAFFHPDFHSIVAHGQDHLEVSEKVTRSEARFHFVCPLVLIESDFRNNHGTPIVTIEWKVPVLLACAWLSFTLIFIL